MSDKIVIKFKPEGDRKLVKAIERLAAAQNKLEKRTNQTTVASKKFNQQQKLVGQRVERNTASFGKLQSTIAVYRNKLLLAAFAATAFSKTIGKLTSLYSEQENAEKKLSVALGSTSQELLDFASAQQEVTTFGDEATISAMAQAAAFTSNEDKIKLLTVAAQDLSAAQGRDLASSMDLLVKSAFSSTNALQRYGIEIDSGLKGSQKLKAITTAIARLYGGQAKAAAETYSGATKQLSDAFGDLGEELGKVFAESLLPLVNGFKELAIILQKFPMGKTIQGVTALGTAMVVTSSRFKTLRAVMLASLISFPKITAAMYKMGAAVRFIGFAFKSVAFFAIFEGISRLGSFLFSLGGQAEKAAPKIDESAASVMTLLGRLKEVKSINQAHQLDQLTAATIHMTKRQIKIAEDALNSAKVLFSGMASDHKDYQAALETVTDSEEKLFKLREKLAEQEDTKKKVEQELENQRIRTRNYTNDLIQKLGRQNQLVKEKLIGDEMSLELLKITQSAKEKDINLTQSQIEQIEVQLEKRQALNDQIAQQTQITSTINSMSQAFSNFILQTNTGLITWRNFGDLVVGQIQRILAQILALRLSITALNALKINVPVSMGSQASGAESLLNLIPGVSAITNIVSGIGSILGFHNGGLVPTSYHSGGEVPAVLQSGEYVMSRSAVDAIGIENLNSLNAGGSAQNVTINVTGNVMSQDFVEGELMQSINNAIRKGFVLDNILEGDLQSAMAMKNLM